MDMCTMDLVCELCALIVYTTRFGACYVILATIHLVRVRAKT